MSAPNPSAPNPSAPGQGGLPRAWLHIGRHKTGSTAIQSFLHKQSDALARTGRRVVRQADYADLSPVLKTTRIAPANLFDLANALLRPELENAVRDMGVMPVLDAAAAQDFAQRANARLHELARNGDGLVLSAEGFSFMRTPEETARLETLFAGFDLRVGLFLRDMDDWVRSYAAQTQGLRRRRPDLAEQPGSVLDLSPGSWQRDEEGLRRVFADVPGAALSTLRYEAALARDGSVIPVFLDWLGVAADAFAADLRLWANRTL